MTEMRITFVHGWGCAPSFWNNVIKRLPNAKYQNINLGFIGNKQDLGSETESSLYVTHSLGTMWALKNRRPQINGLIAINGFTTFQQFTTPRILKTMGANLKRNSQKQMEEFWGSGRLPHHADINPSRLEAGLEWLANWNCESGLKNLESPVLSLIGDKDPILETDKMTEHWQAHETHICNGAGHNLPIAQSEWCAEHIRAFANAL